MTPCTRQLPLVLPLIDHDLPIPHDPTRALILVAVWLGEEVNDA